MQSRCQKLRLVALSLVSSISLSCLTEFSSAEAQIVPDRTLGNESSQITPNVTIKGLPSDRIDGGALRGANLFHSFQDFNIGDGRGAYFTNPAGVTNILGRVTGNNVSNIFGTLGVLGNANLFLINPNGIVFGQNARLDLGGSFLGSTASSVVFDNNIEFSATNPQALPLLTINIPTGLRFRDNSGQILVRGNGQDLGLDGAANGFNAAIGGLRVEAGKNLTLVGGNVSLDGAILQAPEGKVTLGGLLAAGTVSFNTDGSLIFPESLTRGNVALVNRSGINVIGNNGGGIEITAGNIDISGNSLLTAGIGSGLGGVNNQAGDIVLNALGGIEIDRSRVENTVSLNAFSSVREDAIGNGGDVTITARTLSLTNGAQISASTFGNGNAGNVTVNASDSISFDGVGGNRSASGASSSVEKDAIGNGGDVTITARTLSLTNGAQISASTFGQGNSGNVTVNASDSISFDGVDSAASGVFSSVQKDAIGNGGDVTITARTLSLTNSAVISANTFGNGNAGNVTLNASDSISFDGVDINGFPSGAFSSVEKDAIGNGGDVTITARTLSLTNGAVISASTAGQGNAGNVTLNASDSISFDGADGNRSASGALSSVEKDATGNGGDVTITARTLSLTNGAVISAGTLGQGKAGNIFTKTEALVLRNNSKISTDNQNQDGGNITIDTGALATIPRETSNITSNALGRGGAITVNAQRIFGFQRRTRAEIENLLGTTDLSGFDPAVSLPNTSNITAISTTDATLSGTVQFNTSGIDPSQGLVELAVKVVNPDDLIAQNPCVQGRGSQFIVTGRGGLPPSPSEAPNKNAVRVDLIEPVTTFATKNEGQQNSSDIPLSATVRPERPLIPAQGWIIDNKGKVTLTAYDPTSKAANRLSQRPVTSCSLNPQAK